MLRGLLLTMSGWIAVGIVTALGGGESANPLAPGFLLLCVLLLLAPLGLALPAGRALAAPGWASETTIAWAGLGYLLCCVDPARLGQGWALALLLPTLIGVLASPTLLLAAYWPMIEPQRLRLQGYLLSSGLCAVLLLHALGAVSVPTLVLLGLLVLIAQALLITGLQRPARAPASPNPTPLASALAPTSQTQPLLRALPHYAATHSGD